MKCSEQANPYKQKIDYRSTGDGGKRELRGVGFLFGVMEIFWNQVVGMVAQCCEYSKNPICYTPYKGLNGEFYVMWNLSQYKKF